MRHTLHVPTSQEITVSFMSLYAFIAVVILAWIIDSIRILILIASTKKFSPSYLAAHRVVMDALEQKLKSQPNGFVETLLTEEGSVELSGWYGKQPILAPRGLHLQYIETKPGDKRVITNYDFSFVTVRIDKMISMCIVEEGAAITPNNMLNLITCCAETPTPTELKAINKNLQKLVSK